MERSGFVATAPFHEGELALQRRSGAYDALAVTGPRVIRDHMPQQHRDFFCGLPFVVVGALDARGWPRASVLAAPPGFMRSPDPQRLEVGALPRPGDPLDGLLHVGAPVGLLGIEPPTRRRNRMNGTVAAVDGQGFAVQVRQSFGNCPRYIQVREVAYVAAPPQGPVHDASELDDAACRIVAAADTFFIATAHPAASTGTQVAHGVDVSHRGGRSGFVGREGEGRQVLTVPDYAGNHFFNTLGNMMLEPRCGLLFIDGEHGDLLYVTATGQVQWEGAALAGFPGAQCLLRLRVEGVRRLQGALPLRWSDAAEVVGPA